MIILFETPSSIYKTSRWLLVEEEGKSHTQVLLATNLPWCFHNHWEEFFFHSSYKIYFITNQLHKPYT